MVNIYQTAAFNARRTPDRLALCDGSKSLSFSDLVLQSRRVAAALQGLRVGRGDRVAAILPTNGAAVDPERVRAFCKSRLSGFKVPKRIWCVEEIDRKSVV